MNIGFSRRYRLGPPSVGTGIDTSTEALILGRLNVQSGHALTHISLTIHLERYFEYLLVGDGERHADVIG